MVQMHKIFIRGLLITLAFSTIIFSQNVELITHGVGHNLPQSLRDSRPLAARRGFPSGTPHSILGGRSTWANKREECGRRETKEREERLNVYLH